MALTKITSDVIGSGAIESTHIASGAISSSHLTGITTDNVSEGSSNTYFTNARARGAVSVTGGNLSYDSSTGVIQLTTGTIRAQLSGGTGVTYNSTSGAISIGQSVATDATPTFGNTTLTGYLRGPSTFTIDPAAHGDNTGTVVIAGNLQVDGTTTTINSTTLTVDDKLVTLASGSANAAAANGAGIEVDISGATNPSLLYDGTNDQWDFNKSLHIVNNTTDDTILLESTEDSNLAAPVLTFKRHSSSPADADYLGQLKFRGENDADQDIVYAKMTSKISDASDGSEDGTLEFAVRKAGSNNINMRLGPNSLQIINGTNLTVGALTSGKTGTLTINNEGGNIATLQVLSRTNRSVLRVADNDTNGYISAENDIFSIGQNSGLNSANINIDTSNRVGIGTTAPSNKLHVAGVTNTDGIKIQGAQANVSLIIENDATNGVAWDISSTGGGHGYGDSSLHFGVAFGQPKVKFQSDGKVGIGTNSPAAKLHISGNSDVSDEDCQLIIDDVDGSAGSRIPSIQFRSNTGGSVTNQGRIRATDTQGMILSGSSAQGDDLVVQAGKVGIGETSPDKHLHIKNTSTGDTGIVIENTNNAQNLDIDFYNNVGSAQGRIRYAEGAGSFSFAPNVSANDALFINYSGYIGIGTNSPDARLTVNGSANSEQMIITGNNNQSRGLSISTRTNDGGTGGQQDAEVFLNAQDTEHATYAALALGYGGNETLRVQQIESSGATGAVGINEVSPAYTLDVNTTGESNAMRLYQGTGSGKDLSMLLQNQGTGSGDDTLIQLYTAAGAGDPKIRWAIAGNETWEMGIDNSNSDALKISNGSSLGSTDRLRLAGSTAAWTTTSFTIQNAGDPVVLLTNTSANQTLRMDHNSIRTTTAHNLSFLVNGLQNRKLMMASNSNNDTRNLIGIGTSSPGAALHMACSGSHNNTQDAHFYLSKNSGADWSIKLDHGSDDYGYFTQGNGSYAYAVYNQPSSAYRGRWNYDGQIYLNGGSSAVYNINSDVRLKEDITNCPSQWDLIKGLPLKRFKWIDRREGEKWSYGFIAQEVELTNPEFVQAVPQDKEDFDDGIEDPEYKTVAEGQIHERALAALQEAMTRIETLEAKVAELEAE